MPPNTSDYTVLNGLHHFGPAEPGKVDEHNRRRQKSDTGAVIGLGRRKIQATLDVPRLPKQDQEAMALYWRGKSFNTFEDEG